MKNKILWVFIIILIIGGIGFWFYNSSVQAPEKEPEEKIKSIGKPLFPGMSPVNENGEVVTKLGEPVEESVEPGSDKAPHQSRVLQEGEVPTGVIHLKVSSSGFTPDNFEVFSGQVVNLCLTVNDNVVRSFKFKEKSLQAVVLEPQNKSRCISFNAPNQGGDFVFIEEQSRVEGVMTVK